MPSASCLPPGLHGGLYPSHEACRQPVSSNPGLGHALYGAEAVPFLVEDRHTLPNGVQEQGLTELEPRNVAVQIGRIFRGRRARLPSWWCWRRQVLLRS